MPPGSVSSSSVSRVWSPAAEAIADDFARPKSRILRAAGGEEDIRGLDVTMDNALLVCGLERVGYGEGDGAERSRFDRTTGQPFLEGFALEQLHGDEGRNVAPGPTS